MSDQEVKEAQPSEAKYEVYDTPFARFSDFVKDEKDSVRICAIYKRFIVEEAKLQATKFECMPWGKYKNARIEDVLTIDRKYLQWMSKQSSLDNYPEVRNNILAVLE